MATHGDHPSLPEHLESLLMEDVHTVFLKADCPPRVQRGAIGSLKLVEAESSVANWDTLTLEQLEEETVTWCRQMLQHSPTALRCLKAAMNADCDGQAGLQELAGAATLLFYQTEEGQEGRNAYVEKRPPDFGKFVRHP